MDINQLKIVEKLTDSTQKTISEFFKNNEDNQYVKLLIREVASDNFSLKKSIEYGLSQISKVKEEKNYLSPYFFLLSELKNIDSRVRDFILDTSVWCEGADDYSQYFLTFSPAEIYDEKIRPLL